jgi:MerR family redox-sensitive transcriptional activator SoxR
MLTIGQVADRAGLRPSALRYYEERGLIPTAVRRGGKRVYDESILRRLAVIEVAKAAGFELDEIAVLLSELTKGRPSPAWRTAARAKKAEVDGQLRTLARMREVLTSLANCQCTTLEQCAREYLRARAREPATSPLKTPSRRRVADRRFAAG